jgi:large conductance mechanosensitive channel
LAKGESRPNRYQPIAGRDSDMLKEFKTFIARGNVLDLAVAVIIGAAFGRIVTSLTEDVIMPVIGKVFGGLDFSGYFLRMGPVPASYAGSLSDYAALKKAGVPLLGYGAFITQAANFIIVAFIIFLIVRAVNRLLPKPEVGAPAEPADVTLLREIRDELKARPQV